MVEFKFDIDKARRALGDISKGTERVVGNVTPKTTGITTPNIGGSSPTQIIVTKAKKESRESRSKREPEREGVSTARIHDLEDEVRDLKTRIRRLEDQIDRYTR